MEEGNWRRRKRREDMRRRGGRCSTTGNLIV